MFCDVIFCFDANGDDKGIKGAEAFFRPVAADNQLVALGDLFDRGGGLELGSFRGQAFQDVEFPGEFFVARELRKHFNHGHLFPLFQEKVGRFHAAGAAADHGDIFAQLGFAVERIRNIDDIVLVKARNGRNDRHTARGHNNDVGLEFLYVFRGNGGVQLQGHIFHSLEFVHPPGDHLQELGLSWRNGRQIPLAAKGTALFTKRDGMAAFRGNHRDFQSGDAAADDQNLLWHVGFFQLIFGFAAHFRILEAVGEKGREQVVDAALVAADALANIFRTVFLGLFGPVGIRDQGSAQGDHVGLARSDDLFRQLRIANRLDADDRDIHHRLDGRDLVHDRRRAHFGNGHHVVHAFPGNAAPRGHVQRVGSGLDRHLGHLLGFFHLDAVVNTLAGDHPEQQGVVFAHCGADLFHYLDAHTHPVFQAAAVGVVAVVEVGRHHLLQQKALGALDLNGVHSGLLGPDGGVHELLFDILNFLQRDFFGHEDTLLQIRMHGEELVNESPDAAVRGKLLAFGHQGKAFKAAEHQLHAELGTGLVDGVRQLFPPRDKNCRPTGSA